METLVQILDVVDEFCIATALRMQRFLSPRPRERRKICRTYPAIGKQTADELRLERLNNQS